jgi:hypothetical protein
VAVEAEVGRLAVTTEVSETEIIVTMEIAAAGSTVVEGMAAVEEAISRRTTPHRSALKRFEKV